jgi:hypothetical protein
MDELSKTGCESILKDASLVRENPMKPLSVVENFFGSRQPPVSSLKVRVASVINVFIAVRGLQVLLDSDTAIVMRRRYQTFVTEDVSKIDETTSAVVYVKDLKCHKRLKAIQSNHPFLHNILNRITLDDLADETARRLVKEMGKT